ncbi:MAG: hypothetical protein RR630_03935 [Coprobacillus sp.]
MKKKILLVLLTFILCGCNATTTPTKTLKEKVNLSFFYISTCSECKAFKEKAIPYIEEKLHNQVTIEMYDLDEEKTEAVYDKVIDSLDNFDEEFYGKAPFLSVDGYFTLLGYTQGDEEYIVSDIEKAVNKEELSYELEAYRFLYKES